MEVSLSDVGARERHGMVAQCEARIRRLCHRALYVRNLDPHSFVVVCIAVDSRWRSAVDALMPNHDWDLYRQRGEMPIAMGIVFREGFCETVTEALPDLLSPLSASIEAGNAHAVVLNDRGGTVYEVTAAPAESIN